MVRRVAPGVWLLEVGWPEPLGANAYLVDDGEVALVDTGLPVGRRSLAAEIRRTGHDPGAVDRVLLTHYDLDHVGGLTRSEIDAPIYLGAEDVQLVRRRWSPTLCHHKGAFHRLARRLFSLSDVDLRAVEDGETIGGFRAVHTPGHNPGHTVYLHEETKTALLGDLVRETDGTFRPPPWLDSYDTDRIAHSIRLLARESFEHGCVGHGEPISPGGSAALRALASSL